MRSCQFLISFPLFKVEICFGKAHFQPDFSHCEHERYKRTRHGVVASPQVRSAETILTLSRVQPKWYSIRFSRKRPDRSIGRCARP